MRGARCDTPLQKAVYQYIFVFNRSGAAVS
jgi:hypothetical protein